VGVRAPLIVLASVLGVTFVAWISGALAVHVAHDPTGCVPLRAGDRTVRLGRRDVLVHVPRGTTGPLPLVLALHPAAESGSRVALDTGFSRLADRWLAGWRRIDGCRGRPRERRVARGVTDVAWRSCAVEHVRLARAGLAATARTWAFLRAQA
jgi:poly(3-hydroxybutyrate) depolymerase